MTVEHLIALLQQQDPKAPVAIYDRPEVGALVIPDYDLPVNTVFITGK